MPSSEIPLCFYCSEYAKVVKNYPVNFASKDENSFTPRCSFHWRFECSNCGRLTHFNGIAWCSDCKEFTCLVCAEEKLAKKKFLVYDYYYVIPCHKCGIYNPALDFAEYNRTHPFQIGDLNPKEDIGMWMPSGEEETQFQEFPQKYGGLERVLALGKRPTFVKLDSLKDYTPKSTWDAIAPVWVSGEEDYHHRDIILPEVYRMIDVKEGEKILDVACGKGNVARDLVRSGALVTGIDLSKMLDYAIEREEKEKLGITYIESNAEKLVERFERSSFDKVVCNMALMDIEDFKTTLKQISYVLKDNGIFVFSITHPAFAWPNCTSLRIPGDSRRNEDKLRILFNYFDERPTLLDFSGDVIPPQTYSLQFPRPISSYFNELVKNNLILKEMSEPKASEDLVNEIPSDVYLNKDIRPDFLIVKTVKKSDF